MRGLTDTNETGPGLVPVETGSGPEEVQTLVGVPYTNPVPLRTGDRDRVPAREGSTRLVLVPSRE